MDLKSKIIVGLSLASLSGWGLYLSKKPAPEAKTVIQDRVQYVDRVVTKDVVRTVTKPDGTKIVTETKEATVSKESLKETNKTVSTPVLSKYSLGVSVRPDFSDLRMTSQTYEIEAGKRLGQSLVWATASVSARGDLKDPEVSVGLRLEF